DVGRPLLVARAAHQRRRSGSRIQRRQAPRRSHAVKRRALVQAAFSAVTWAAFGCDQTRPTAKPGARVVSLSPAITETLFAIGAGAQLVGVSDYWNFPEAAPKLTGKGPALHPNH